MSHSNADQQTAETRMPARLIVQRPGGGLSAGQAFVLETQNLTVGRESDCALRIDEAGVSRRHATLTLGSDGHWSVTDHNSTNGTWVNGRRIAQCRLKDGDQVHFGPNSLLRFSWVGNARVAVPIDPNAATLFTCDLTTFEMTWSEAFDRMLEVSPGTLSGAPLKLEAIVAPEDCSRLRAALLLAERGIPMDVEIRTSVGRRHLELRGERVPGPSPLISGSAWDITARHRQTQSLRRHAALFESFSDPVALLDLQGAVLDCNTPTLRFLDKPKEALVGKSLDSAGHPGWTAAALDKVRRLGRFEDEWKTGSASVQSVCEVVVTPLLDERGGPQGFVIVFRDVTETRALQSRLVMADRLTAMGTLAAGVAHEINNPLAYLRANLSHLIKSGGVVGEDAAETLTDCAEGVERIARIVRDLKFFSHQGSSEVAATDVTKAIGIAAKMAEPVLRHRAHVHVDLGELPLARAEEARLTQVILNLLINAAQAMPERAAEENRITVSARAEAGGVLVEVSDNGSGMTPEVLRRVFDPFFTTKPTGVGSGLGLSICHGIIEGFGGTITARSTLGEGTTFRVWLGAAASDVAEHTVEAQPANDELPTLRVLVIDDEARVVKALSRMLGTHHQVTCVHGAAEALEKARGGAAWDVVLCDVMMPNMSGLELHGHLAEERPDLAERFIFMTGGGFSPRIQQQLDGTGCDLLDKPLDQIRLFSLLHSHSGKKNYDDTIRFQLAS